jgi:hypothetical protein
MQKIKLVALILCLLTYEILFHNYLFASAPILKKLAYQYNCLQKKYNDLVTYCNCMRCVARSLDFLSLLDKQQYCFSLCNCIRDTHCIQIDTTRFFNPQVKACIQKMERTQSLKPLIALLRKTQKNYPYHNNQLIHEIFLLIFAIHKQIFLEKYQDKPQTFKKVDLNTILEISERINQLPIAEVLNAIDMLITELPPFLEKYEFNSKISWKDWLKKYWWVPPIFGGWFALKILLSLQRPHYYFSPYLSSRPTMPLPPITTNDPVLAEIIVDKKKDKSSDA